MAHSTSPGFTIRQLVDKGFAQMGNAVIDSDTSGDPLTQAPDPAHTQAPNQAPGMAGTGCTEALDHAVLEALVSTARDAIVLIDRQAQVLSWNRAAEQIFGHSFKQAVGRNIHALIAPLGKNATSNADIAAAMQCLSQTGGGDALDATLELEAVHRDTRPLKIELSLSSVSLGGRWFGLGVMRDITERKQLEHALALTERNFRSVVELNRSGILLLDREGNICFANEAAQMLLHRSREELIGMPFGTPSGQLRSEMAVRRRDGSRGTAEMSATETEWQGEQAFLVMLHDVTELKEAEASARFLALHDVLTGLPNRRLFHERLERSLERARGDGQRVAVLFVDLNRFKAINDGLGHQAGDEVLREIAQRLSRCLRASDMVARLGGDEFSAVIEGIKQLSDLDAVAAKLKGCLGSSLRAGETDLTIRASIGVAVFPDHGADADTLLRHADNAMYAAKRDGSRNFRLFAASMEKTDAASLRLEQALNTALERGEMRLAYQPIGRVADRMMMGTEALLRWQNPIFGNVAPDRFIPLLEASGRINQVGLWVVEQACAQLAAWRDAGVDLVPVAVNVSAVQLVDGHFPDLVKETLERFAIPPGLLTIELTETAIVEDETVGVLALERLTQLGVWLHMDDFGTGWSSLGLLRKLPFDVVKIDRSFVTDITHGEADALLVAGIISMAHSLNKQVIAEGVETGAQLALLRDYQCDNAQGWLLGHPEAPAQIEQLLRERKALC